MQKHDMKALLRASAILGLYGHLIADKRKEYQPIFDSARLLLEGSTDQSCDEAALILLQESIEDLEWIVNKYAK